jgi:hypothetical protein
MKIQNVKDTSSHASITKKSKSQEQPAAPPRMQHQFQCEQQPCGPTDGRCRRSTSLDRATRPRLHAAQQNCVHGIRLGRFIWNRPVHRFHKKTGRSIDFYWFNCTSGLLSESDRFRLWFGLLAAELLVRSGPNN